MTKGIAAFGKRLPEELEDGRDRSLRTNAGGRSVTVQRMNLCGYRKKNPYRVRFRSNGGCRSREPSAPAAPAASALCWQWWADMRRHRDALARKRHIRRPPDAQVDGEQQQRYESFSISCYLQVFPLPGHVPPVTQHAAFGELRSPGPGIALCGGFVHVVTLQQQGGCVPGGKVLCRRAPPKDRATNR